MSFSKTAIMDLISLKREGEYWDFKEKYHQNKAKFIHDILCLSNIPSRNDSYLIFGVSDHGEIKGVSNDEGRKTQAMIVDMLRNTSFAGGNVPFITIETITLNSKEIDVLIIKNSDNTPFYLEKKYKDGKTCIPAGTIYTRRQDTNTPIDSVASQQEVEYLWRKRFGIDLSPFDRLLHYIEDKDGWESNSVGRYYKQFPEFVFVEDKDSEDRSKDVYYAHNMMNSRHYFMSYQFKYHQTILYEDELIVMDSGRYTTSSPRWEILSIDKEQKIDVSYNYFIDGSPEWLIHKFLLDEKNQEACSAQRRFLELILVFESVQEKEEFDKLIVKNLIYENLDIFRKPKLSGDTANRTKIINTHDIQVAKFLNAKLRDFRSHKNF